MAREKTTLKGMVFYISQEVAEKEETIYRVVESLGKHIGEALNRRADVVIKGIGTFTVRDDEHGIPKVKFTPSLNVQKYVKVSPEMNKYNVVLDQNKTMTAKLTGKCPDCKSPLETTDPPKCPQCGTKPFEDRPQLEEGNG